MRKRGFTLIELMVTMAIIAVLAVLVIGAISIARRSSKDTQRRSNIRSIQSALEAYAQANGGRYPLADPALRSLYDIKYGQLSPYLANALEGSTTEANRYCYYSNDSSNYRLFFIPESSATEGVSGLFSNYNCTSASLNGSSIMFESFNTR